MGSYDTMVINDGAIDYWKLDRDTGELSDLVSLTNSDLTSTNATSGSTPVSLLPGSNNLYSNYFDGTDATVHGSIASPTCYHPMFDTASQAGSVECWLKADTVDTLADFVSLVVKSGSWGLCLNYGKLAFFTEVSSVKRITATSSAISTGTVYHVCGTFDPNTGDQILYVDGSSVDTLSSLSGPADQNSAQLCIGSWDTSVLFFNGRISNVALYLSALDATSIGNHAAYDGS